MKKHPALLAALFLAGSTVLAYAQGSPREAAVAELGELLVVQPVVPVQLAALVAARRERTKAAAPLATRGQA